MGIKNRDEWLNEGHSYDQELENARNFKSSASELQQWAERKIAESRPENFKEGIINPIQESDMTNKYGGFLITYIPNGMRLKATYKKGVDSKKREEAAFAKILKDNPKVKEKDLKITGYFGKKEYADLVQDIPVRLDESKDSYAIMRLVNGRTKELIEGTIEEIVSQFSKAIDNLRNSGSGKQFKEDPKTIEELVHYLNAAQQYAEKKDNPKNTYAIQESINEGINPNKVAEVLFQELAAARLIGKQNRRAAVNLLQKTISKMNFNESVVTEASRWKGKEIYPNWVKPTDIEGFVKKESDLEVGKDYVLYEPGMDSWQAEYTYKGKIKGEYTFSSSAQFSTSPDERFTRKELDAMIKDLELAVMESINEARKPITKKHWDKADDDQKEEWLLQAYSDPNDAEEHIYKKWNDLPPQATSNMFESLDEADKEWSDDVKTDWSPPKGLFTEPANKIADVLHKESDDLDQAMSRLMFYINRAGKLLSPKVKAELETAKKLLQQKYA